MGCIASLCEPADEWTIMDDARPDERGAGQLHSQGNGKKWAQRFFVIKDGLLIRYHDATRLRVKGIIKLFNASVKIPGNYHSGGTKWYFQIAHTHYGIRDFYAANERRRDQWVLALQEEIQRVQNIGHWEGNLLKRGGYSGKQWQSRWCIVFQGILYYYEHAHDDFPKGSIELLGAKFRELSVSDQQYCIEVVARSSTSGKMIKRVFAVETYMDRQQLTAMLNTQSRLGRNSLKRALGLSIGDPDGKEDEDRDSVDSGPQNTTLLRQGQQRSSDATITPRNTQPRMQGYVMKRSPRVMGGWQKRFLVLLDDGTLSYYGSEYDMARKPPKGRISLVELLPDSPSLTGDVGGGFSVGVPGRTYEFMCDTTAIAIDWINNIKSVAECLSIEED